MVNVVVGVVVEVVSVGWDSDWVACKDFLRKARC